MIPRGREGRVLSRADDLQGARRNERCSGGQVGHESVDEIDAVAILLYGFQSHVVLHRPRRAGCRSHLRAVVNRRGKPGHGPATRDARQRDPMRIHFGATLQVVEGANGIPHFRPGGRVAERKPIPHAQVVRAVMDAGDLAELNRVDDQAHVTVPGEPDAVMLEATLALQGPGSWPHK